MSFDQSRSIASPWRPWRDFLGVVMQQGRVQLDSDWNELLAELSRRIQAGTLDILGVSGVPSTTPFGFKINASFAAGNVPHVTIGAGRIYVDGLLVENHGPLPAPQWSPVAGNWSDPPQAPIAWDPSLGEWSGAPQIPGITEADVDFTQQPYLPQAALPAGNGPFLVYLDVWQREVSSLQDPTLIETAVGVDTTGRLQTVWQVKLLDISSVTGAACATADASIGPWANLIQPSSSQLSNGLVQLGSSGSCALTPAASYTGLENQLYRVEIHQAGAPAVAIPGASTPAGTATFKWSRENASVATLVTAIASVSNSAGNTASQLTVQSLGRDQVLGFNPGDWIEITDDYLELNFQQLNPAGLPGELHKIVSIDPAAKAIVLDGTVSATSFPVQSGGQTFPYRHTRIRRWDQAGTVYLTDGATAWYNLDAAVSAGVTAGASGIPVPSPNTAVLLEDGIAIAFPAGNAFRAGEFWTFAARTADGSLEPLTNAPPAGVLHHYCRLGIVNFTASPPVVSDCRKVFTALANPSLHVTQVLAGSTPLSNNTTVSIQTLLNSGIAVSFDAPLSPAVVAPGGANSPIFSVSVDLPSTAAGEGFNRLILPASVTVGPASTLKWTPSIAAASLTAFEGQFSTTVPLVARLTLKGSFIWAQGNTNVYLNGAGDGRPYADFEMWFWVISQPAVTLSATSLTFTTPQSVGTSVTQSIVLTNNSSAALTITAITIAGTNPADFTTPAIATPVTVGAAGSATSSYTINITFDPQAAGSRSAVLTIAGTVAAQSPQTVALAGTAIQPAVSASVGSLIFPSTIVGATSAQQPVVLTNAGSSQLAISAVSATPGFLWTSPNLTSAGAGTLQPSGQCTIQVQFKPTAAGSPAGSLVIAHNAPNSPLSIGLTGTAIAGTPAITPSVTSYSFGSIGIGQSSTATITITSSGTTALSITGVSAPGGVFTLVSNACSTLQPTQQCTIQVRFSPTGASSYSGTLVISHNAPGSPLNIALSGTGHSVKTSSDKVTDKKADVLDQVKSIVLDTGKGPVLQTLKPAVVLPEDAAAESATSRAFILPEERPAVGPQPEQEGPASGESGSESAGEEPKE